MNLRFDLIDSSNAIEFDVMSRLRSLVFIKILGNSCPPLVLRPALIKHFLATAIE